MRFAQHQRGHANAFLSGQNIVLPAISPPPTGLAYRDVSDNDIAAVVHKSALSAKFRWNYRIAPGQDVLGAPQKRCRVYFSARPSQDRDYSRNCRYKRKSRPQTMRAGI